MSDRMRHAQPVTRVRRTGLDAMGRRFEKAEPLVFEAAFAPTTGEAESDYRQSTRGAATFYTDKTDIDVVTGDLLSTIVPVTGAWRVVEVKPWVNPYTGKKWGLEIVTEVSADEQSHQVPGQP